VELPYAGKQVSDGVFTPDERQTRGVDAVVEQVVAYGEALRPLQARSTRA
jgi:hypothetical protein